MGNDNRIGHMLRQLLLEAQEAAGFAGSAGSYEAFTQNSLIRKGVVLSLINIAHLAGQLPQEYKKIHNGIPWRSLEGMRSLACLGCQKVDDGIIWNIAETTVSDIIAFITKQNGRMDAQA